MLRRSSATSLQYNSINFVHHKALLMCALRCNPRPFQPNPQMRDAFSHTAFSAPSDLAYLAHFDYQPALHALTNQYRYYPLARPRFSRDHRTLYSTASQRRTPTLPLHFPSTWASCDNLLTTTSQALTLAKHNKPTRRLGLGSVNLFSGAQPAIIRIPSI